MSCTCVYRGPGRKRLQMVLRSLTSKLRLVLVCRQIHIEIKSALARLHKEAFTPGVSFCAGDCLFHLFDSAESQVAPIVKRFRLKYDLNRGFDLDVLQDMASSDEAEAIRQVTRNLNDRVGIVLEVLRRFYKEGSINVTSRSITISKKGSVKISTLAEVLKDGGKHDLDIKVGKLRNVKK